MNNKRHMEELMILVAKDLSAMHGVFFAASFLAERGISLDLALSALVARRR